MATYIISNRKVIRENVELASGESVRLERFTDKAKSTDISLEFRVAKYDESLPHNYEIYTDFKGESYTRAASANPATLAGSKRMFAELFQAGGKPETCGDILFFIHGFGNSFSSNLEHIQSLNEHYVREHAQIKHLVFFSWPSFGSLMKYKDDQSNAQATGEILGRLFHKLRAFYEATFRREVDAPCLQRIHIGAHSMGNEVLYNMMKNLNHSDVSPFFKEALLFNADTHDNAFETGQPFERLAAMSDRVHVYIHHSDDALFASDKYMGNSKRLGKYGPSNRATLPQECWVVDTTSLAEDRFKLSTTKEQAIDHWGYMKREEVIADVQAVFEGEDEYDILGRRPSPKPNTFKLASS